METHMSKWMHRSIALLLLAGAPAALAESGMDGTSSAGRVAVQASESVTTPQDREARRIQAVEVEVAALHASENQNPTPVEDSKPQYDTDSHPLWP